MANKIINSPTLKADLEAECLRAGVEEKQMIRDVQTRWNSTAELIQRALDLKEPLKALIVKQEYNKPCGIRLAWFQLSNVEWDLLE